MAMGETFRIEMDVDVKDNTEPGLSKAEKKISSFEKSMKSVESRLRKMGNTKVNMALDAVDKASAVIKKVKSSVKSLAGKAVKVVIGAKDMASNVIKGILGLASKAGEVMGISFGITDSIDTFKGFEAAMSQVKAISGATAEQMDLLNAKAKEMGATTKFTATEAGEAFNYMAMAGWQTGDMLNGIEGILNLAAASGESLGTTSDIVTDALTAFGLKASDAGHFADVLAVASSSANTNVSMMGETFKYVGAASGALGYSIEDVALGIGLMANSGIKASQAGTELNSIFTRLSTDTNGARKAIEALGVSFYRSDGSARAFGDVMLDLREATKEMTQEEKMNFANKVAGMRAQAGLLAMLNATTGDYNKLTQAIKASDGASKDMADTMLDNLEGSLTLLQSAVDGAKMNLGERLSLYLRQFADWLTSAMPQVNKAIDSVMDFVDEKIENLKNRIGEMTAGMDWQNADFFGKVKIAWDTIIAEPFSEWWNTSGKAMMAEKAASIGQGIGAAISSGLMGLLGIDIGGAADEGASIGMAFGKGLASGFDIQGLKSKVGDAIKSLFSNAADILPGGDSAKLSSWLSAALIAKMGKGAIGAGWKAMDIGKGIAGSGAMGRFRYAGSFGTELGGGAIAGGSGLLGLLGKTGMALGSGATTSAGLVAAGGGAIAGGVAGSAALISGIRDLTIAFDKNTEADKSMAYGKSGSYKVGGVGAGAAAGAMIGAYFGGIGAVPGALIGAGIGGIAGWIKGKKEVEEYQEAVDKAALAEQEAALKAALATEQAKYASQELKDALANGASDSEFAYMLQRIESKNLKSHFGDITLSLEEIKSLAQSIIIPKEAASNLDTFAWASQSAEKSLGNLQSSLTAMEKLNWRADLGLELDETDMESYKAGIDNLITSAEQYLDSKHFEASMALNILVDEGDPSGIIAGVDAMYAKLQDELNSVGEELTAQVNIALEDGVIDADEQKIIAELQQKVREITERVSDAELDAKMQVLNMKYSGAQLDYASFSSLQQELAAQVQAYTDQYQEALTVGITALNLELDDNAISNEEYNAAVQELQNNYQARIEDMQVKVESFQLDAIAGAYSDALDGLLPEMQGTTAEKLSAGLHDAIACGIDAADWNADTVRQFLGLENLQTEAAEELAQLMGMVMETVPTQMVEAIRETADPSAISEPVTEILDEGVTAGAENMDASQVGQAVVDKVGESVELAGHEGLGRVTKEMVEGAFRDLDVSEGAEILTENIAGSIEAVDNQAIPEAVGNQINSSMEDLELLPAAESIMAKLTDSLAEADYTAIGEMLLGGMLGYFEEADFAELGMMLTVHIAESLTAEENLAMLETAAQTVAAATDMYLNNEFSLNVGNEAGNDVPGNISQSLDRNKENVHPGCDAIVLEVDSYLTGQLNSLTVNASPTVNITPKYVVNGDPPDLAGRVGVVRANATGGIVSGKQLSWVGEEGPEMIIPLVSGRRTRALELYEKAGEMLGVDKNADGGIIGLNENSVPVSVPDGGSRQNKGSGENRVVVEMSVAPNITISSGSGSDAEEIRRMVEQAIRNMMEDVSDGLSRKLSRQMANMGMV